MRTTRTRTRLYINEQGGPLGFHFVDEAASYGIADHNAGMGVAAGDYNGDGRPDLFVTNSRGQPRAAYPSSVVHAETAYVPETEMFGAALHRKATVGWGDSWVDLANDGKPPRARERRDSGHERQTGHGAGKTMVDELPAGSSYLSSEDPRAHFGLGAATRVKLLTVRYPTGKIARLRNVRANRIVTIA